MDIFIITLVGVLLVTSVAGVVVAYQLGVKLLDAQSDLARETAGHRGARSTADRFEMLFLERDKSLARAQKVIIESAGLYAEASDAIRQQEQQRYKLREEAFIAQIQVMAERLATLKLRRVEGVDDTLVIAEDNVVGIDLERFEQPYSAGLSDFMNALDSEDSRELVEAFIEARRTEGMIDAQILEKLERGDY